LVTWDPEPGPDGTRLVTSTLRALDEAARRHDVRLAGGISLGAALALRWAAAGSAATAGLDGLVLALPAWSGPPEGVAAASAAAAVERLRLADPGRDRAVLGAAALRALRRAAGSGAAGQGGTSGTEPDRTRPVTRQDRERG